MRLQRLLFLLEARMDTRARWSFKAFRPEFFHERGWEAAIVNPRLDSFNNLHVLLCSEDYAPSSYLS